jgi:hypothetical protein
MSLLSSLAKATATRSFSHAASSLPRLKQSFCGRHFHYSNSAQKLALNKHMKTNRTLQTSFDTEQQIDALSLSLQNLSLDRDAHNLFMRAYKQVVQFEAESQLESKLKEFSLIGLQEAESQISKNMKINEAFLVQANELQKKACSIFPAHLHLKPLELHSTAHDHCLFVGDLVEQPALLKALRHIEHSLERVVGAAGHNSNLIEEIDELLNEMQNNTFVDKTLKPIKIKQKPTPSIYEIVEMLRQGIRQVEKAKDTCLSFQDAARLQKLYSQAHLLLLKQME